MERAKVTAEDSLIFFDYVDGWSQSPQVLDYLIELNSTNNCVFIRGNHDELLHWLKTAKTTSCGTSMVAKQLPSL
jgi:serine/threonine protein phosphatase 1